MDKNSSNSNDKSEPCTSSDSSKGINSSSPKQISFDQVINAANSFRDMSLLQHIIDKDFKLDDGETCSDNAETVIKDVCKKAFWDVVRENFKKNPTDYTQVLCLLEDIKTTLTTSLTLPHQKRIRDEINEKLDSVLIKQQADNNILKIEHYTQYIISMMSKLCSPARDEKIKKLSELTDIIEIFRGIFETMDLMKIDMANFVIGCSKSDVLSQSADWERNKFEDVMVIQQDGLYFTKIWLSKYIEDKKRQIENNSDSTHIINIRNIVNDILSKAYVDLLEWDDSKTREYPETLVLNRDKLMTLRLQFKKITVCASILVHLSNAINFETEVMKEFKVKLKNEIGILLDAAKTYEEVNSTVKDIVEYILKQLSDRLNEINGLNLSDDLTRILRNQMNQVADEDNAVRKLLARRLRDFYVKSISLLPNASIELSSSLMILEKEIYQIVGIFRQMVERNQKVYSEYYFDIIETALKN